MRLTASLGTTLGAIFGLFAALLLVNIIAVAAFAGEGSERFATASVATAERALINRARVAVVALADGRVPAGDTEEAGQLLDLVDRNLDALMNGGEAQTQLDGRQVTVAAPDASLARTLADIAAQWRPLANEVRRALEAGVESPEMQAAATSLITGSSGLLADLDRVSAVVESEFRANNDARFGFAIGLAGVALVAVVAGWFWVRRRVIAPVVALAAATRQVADGDLGVEVEVGSASGELGVLTDAFADMAANLRASLEAERSATENLSAAASEILAAATQLTSGASQQAAAVAEISTSGEEVRVTAEAAARRAEQVAESVNTVSEVGNQGRAAIAEARSGMGDLRGKVETIAERILALSEQTQAIGEITGSVDELADQSNLLAVNAAIEAAKAGEHGRGFSVVAQEVRNLADQSRAATDQIRTVLGQIQKSAHAAVLVTEDGTRAVESGSRLVDQAGDVIEQLAATLSESAVLAREIAISSEQQRAGVDQVASGIGEIDEVSRQTAAAARQLQTEAEGLAGLAEDLRAMSQRFHLDRAPAATGDRAPFAEPARA